MSSITETAQACFEACGAGIWWSVFRTWCAPNATLAAQDEPQGLMTVRTDATYEVKSCATDTSARGRAARFLGVMIAANLLAGPMSSFAARAQQPTEPAPAPSTATQTSAEEAAKREVWRATIARTPAPKKGCFTASYPNAEWQEVPCGRPSPYPNPPRRPRPNFVGYTIDYSAQASGLISSAVGSFASVTPATITEQGAVPCQPPPPPPRCAPNAPHCPPNNPAGDGGNVCPVAKVDSFSLQLNSQFFELNAPFELNSQASQIAACLNRTAACGWEQFVFSQYGCPDGPCVYIQYWLLDYGTTSPPPPSACATPWAQGGDGSTDWYCNSSSAPVPHVSAAQLQETTLTGTAAADGDRVALAIAGDAGLMAPSGGDTMLNLAQHWNAVEWGVFGVCCGYEAGFSAGSTIVVKTSVNGGAVATCVQEGFTAETNNLSLVGTPAQNSPLPVIVFTQSDAAGGTPASCVAEGPPVPPGTRHGGPGPACGHGHLPPCRKP